GRTTGEVPAGWLLHCYAGGRAVSGTGTAPRRDAHEPIRGFWYPESTMRINVVQLKKYYGPTRAVDDISFAFASGQIFGFVGPNGAGKTTTMRILATVEEPTAGDAFLDGVSVVEQPEKARRLVGYVPDSLPTHRDMSVRDYLDFFGRAYGLKGGHRRQVVQ